MKLHYKLSASILLGLLIIVAVAQYYQYAQSDRMISQFSESVLDLFKTREEQAARDLFDSVVRAISGSLERGEMEKFTTLLEIQKETPGVEELSLYDANGVVTHSSHADVVGTKTISQSYEYVLQRPDQEFAFVNDTIEIYQPQVVERDCIRCHQTWEEGAICGVINMRFSTQKTLSAAQRVAAKTVSSTKRTFLLNSLVVFLGIVLVFMATMIVSVNKFVKRPLDRLLEGVKAMAQGERKRLKIADDIDRSDEIGILANAIVEMDQTIRNVLEETDRLTQAIQDGRLSARGHTDEFSGGWRELVTGVNNVIDAFVSPFKTIVVYLDHIANGDLPEEISTAYQGDFNKIKDNVNLLIRSTRQVIQLAQAIAGGNLNVNVGQRSERDELMQALQQMIIYLQDVADVTEKISRKELDVNVVVTSEQDVLKPSLQRMVTTLQTMMAEIEDSMKQVKRQHWLSSGQAELANLMRGEQDVPTLARSVIAYLAKYTHANVGTLYLANDENECLQLVGSYSFTIRKGNRNRLKFGEGVVGQAALERQAVVFTDLPDDYLPIASSVGEAASKSIIVVPLIYDNNVKGVIELGAMHAFTKMQRQLLEQVSESIAIAFLSAQTRVKMQELLEATREQAKELQTQQEQLRGANEELEAQTETLRASEQKLQQQQEELRQTNEELEQQTKALERQQRELRENNLELENARHLVEQKAREVELSSKYKSEFLANMSHELRTPLNSLLILSKLLSENKNQNLTEKQVEYARTIHSSGADLLELINEVLDLSKIEAGKMTANVEEVRLTDIADYLSRHFAHVAQQKGVVLHISIAEDAPPVIATDEQRVQQILKNLLSNALKFTEEGSVMVSFGRPDPGTDLSQSGLQPARAVAIAVADTGIGIPPDKQALIFEAFHQADGTTSRRYGGTGLGLSIVREFSRLLGGEIQLSSEVGQGSIFTLYVPEKLEQSTVSESEEHAHTPAPRPIFAPAPSPVGEPTNHPIADRLPTTSVDRGRTGLPVQPAPARSAPPSVSPQAVAPTKPTSGKSLLIIEDDAKFARILSEIAREKTFTCLFARDGTTGLRLAAQQHPDAIILDIGLPGMDGWTVMKHLKSHPDTRHIPVHFISAQDDASLDALKMGAIGFLTKPVSMDSINHVFAAIETAITHTIKRLLIVEDDEVMGRSLLELLGGEDVAIMTARTGQEAFRLLKTQAFDCVVLDLGLADVSGFTLLEQIKADPTLAHLPVIVYTGKDLNRSEETQLRKHAESIILKGVKSEERLLDEVTLFLHRVETQLPAAQQQQLRRMHDKDEMLHEKTVLLVDDDMRNVFALATVLEEKGMAVLIAEHGKAALAQLAAHPEVQLVLMDIMMPEMDGYEALRQIRAQPQFRRLPIIALTAKAMKGDREKCLEAGANDYLSKPIDIEKLLSLLRVWLY